MQHRFSAATWHWQVKAYAVCVHGKLSP